MEVVAPRHRMHAQVRHAKWCATGDALALYPHLHCICEMIKTQDR